MFLLKLKMTEQEIEFKNKVIELLLEDGADQKFIDAVVTDNIVIFAIKNGFSTESLAWAVSQ